MGKKSVTAALYLEFSANRLSGVSELQVQDLKEHPYVFGKSVSELKQAISLHFL